LYFFSILRHNLSKFVTQTGLYCSKQLETTFNQFGKKNRCISPLNGSFKHIMYQPSDVHENNLPNVFAKHLHKVTQHIPALDQLFLNNMRIALTQIPNKFTIDVQDVYSLLTKVKLQKSVGPDRISHKIFKKLADVFAAPAIINFTLWHSSL